jgi:hypothetical protein
MTLAVPRLRTLHCGRRCVVSTFCPRTSAARSREAQKSASDNLSTKCSGFLLQSCSQFWPQGRDTSSARLPMRPSLSHPGCETHPTWCVPRYRGAPPTFGWSPVQASGSTVPIVGNLVLANDTHCDTLGAVCCGFPLNSKRRPERGFFERQYCRTVASANVMAITKWAI